MMSRSIVLALLVVVLSGCNTPWYKLKLENQRLSSDLGTLAGENEDLRRRLKELGHDVQDKSRLIASIQEREAERLRELERLRKQLEGTGIDVKIENGQAILTLPNTILFASGRHELLKQSKKALDAVVKVINGEYANYLVSIEGHTDTDPIVKSKDRYQDNYDLSAARARSVLKHLIANGVEEKRLRGTFHAANRPVASNNNTKGKAKNRRVEIVLIR